MLGKKLLIMFCAQFVLLGLLPLAERSHPQHADHLTCAIVQSVDVFVVVNGGGGDHPDATHLCALRGGLRQVQIAVVLNVMWGSLFLLT